jgi:hypothetical protein
MKALSCIVLCLLMGAAQAQVNPGTSPLSIPKGGTGAATASTARSSLGLGSMATQNANGVAITGGTITGLPTPSTATDAASKSYVDGASNGLTIQSPSRLATAAVLPNTPTYANGTAGVGATLTAGANSTLTIDGTVANVNDVVLVKNQASAFQNGIYTVTNAGSGSVAWVLTRVTYFDQASEMVRGSYTFITAGSANIGVAFTLQASVTTVGTDSLSFVIFTTPTTSFVPGAVTAQFLATSAIPERTGILNGTIVESHASNAVTFALKTLAGADPSSSAPVYIAFSNGAGGYTVLSVTAALSRTISAGSTLGVLSSSTATRLGIVAVNNSGTVVLGVGNFPSPPSSDYLTFNTVAEGGAGAADSSETIYTATSLTGVQVQPLAYAIYNFTITTPGNWTASPTNLNMWTTDRAAMPYDLTTRPETPPSQFTGAIFRPKTANSLQYLDLGVNGTPSPSAAEGLLGWYDTCDSDLIANPQANTSCSRLAVDGNHNTIVGQYNYGPSPTAGDIFFYAGGIGRIKIFASNGSMQPVANNASTLGFSTNIWSGTYSNQYFSGPSSTQGVSCSGAPTAAFASVNGIVTHC